MIQLKDKLNNILINIKDEDDLYGDSILSNNMSSSIHVSPQEKVI